MSYRSGDALPSYCSRGRASFGLKIYGGKLNFFKQKLNIFHLNTQSVPRSKQTASGLYKPVS